MATETQTVNSKVEQVDVNLDEIFNAAPSGADMIQDVKATPKSIFSGLNKKADMSFADPDIDDVDDISAKVEDKDETKDETNEGEIEEKEDVKDILDSFDPSNEEDADFEDEKKETR